MDTVGPHIYHYLHHPLFSSGEAMLYYALEHLVFTGAITFDHSRVHPGHDDHRLVDRLFLHRAAGTEATGPEGAALDLIPRGEAYSLADLRRKIDHVYPDLHAFKAGPMQEHLLGQGLLSSPSFTTAEGRKAYRHVHHLLHQVEHEEEHLLADAARLHGRLAELGSNVVLLHHGFLEKLRDRNDLEPLLKTVLILQTFLESGGYFHTRRMG
ncbi:MAG: hypothetical protein KJZ58_00995 [Flavobacteriales bacterium]|nr:hypothetical protein [Flavobacteriales bacterium]